MRDFVRSALFNILNDFVPNAHFLDLYCGTGSVGLEALSRGAALCTFVDRSAGACAIVRRNLDALDLFEQGRVIEQEAIDGIEEMARRARRFDVIFIGPPYYHELVPATLEALANGTILVDDFVVVAETHQSETAASDYGVLQLVDQRRYGDNRLLFYRRAGSQGGETV